MSKGKVDGLDAILVLLTVSNIMQAPNRVR